MGGDSNSGETEIVLVKISLNTVPETLVF